MQINGNLDVIPNFQNFQNLVLQVYFKFVNLFGINVMTKIPLFVDNATAGSGYTPIITPIFKQYLCIKLNINNFLDNQMIIYQLAHELCHYVFYSIKGIDKTFADDREETICSAMSLCILKGFYDDIQRHIDHVKGLENFAYRDGAALAESVNYDSNKLRLIIIIETENEK